PKPPHAHQPAGAAIRQPVVRPLDAPGATPLPLAAVRAGARAGELADWASPRLYASVVPPVLVAMPPAAARTLAPPAPECTLWTRWPTGDAPSATHVVPAVLGASADATGNGADQRFIPPRPLAGDRAGGRRRGAP